jgi:hypothetical protein
MFPMESEGLVDRIRGALGRLTDEPIVEKRMFGGVGFMWRGRLVVGTHGTDELILPLGKDVDAGEGLRPMVMGKRASAGWYFAAPEAFASDAALDGFIEQAMAYVATRPTR